MFFGIGFIVNMLLKRTWVLSFLYPIILILIIDNLSIWEYFTNSIEAFNALGGQLSSLTTFDILIFLAGFLGTITSGIVMKQLRKSGYSMF